MPLVVKKILCYAGIVILSVVVFIWLVGVITALVYTGFPYGIASPVGLLPLLGLLILIRKRPRTPKSPASPLP